MGVIAIHFVILSIFQNKGVQPRHVASPPPIDIEITRPPPPPPPVIQPPKPLPQVAKPAPAPVHHVAAPRPRPAPAPAPTPVTPSVQAPVAEPSLAPVPAAPVVAEAKSAPPAPAPVERVTEAHGSAGYLHNPPPVYPDEAQERNWQGRVLLKVHVRADGHPDDVRIAQSSGYQLLDNAAVKTVTHWLFAPATRGDVPIDGWANVPIDFRLSN